MAGSSPAGSTARGPIHHRKKRINSFIETPRPPGWHKHGATPSGPQGPPYNKVGNSLSMNVGNIKSVLTQKMPVLFALLV
jgi:hypothetical protein